VLSVIGNLNRELVKNHHPVLTNVTNPRCVVLRRRLVRILIEYDEWITADDLAGKLFEAGQLTDSVQRIGNVLATTAGVKRAGTDPQKYKMKEDGATEFDRWLNR